MLEARQLLQRGGTPHDLRRLRAAIVVSDLGGKKALMSRRDFYTRSEFKDLVANNRERNYSPADIGQLLAGLPLRIASFSGIAPEDAAASTDVEILRKVEELEARQPTAYSGMYMFTLQVQAP